LKEIAKTQQVAIIMVTHDERLLTYCDKILHVSEGKVEVTELAEASGLVTEKVL